MDNGNFMGMFTHPIVVAFFVVGIVSVLLSVRKARKMKNA